RHREYREAEGQRYADEPDPQPGERRGEHRAAAASEHEPRRPQELRAQSLRHFDVSSIPAASGVRVRPARRPPRERDAESLEESADDLLQDFLDRDLGGE